MKFPRAPAPHLRPPNSITAVMAQVLLAMVPAAAAHVWFFGPGLLVNMVIAGVVAVASEALMLGLRNRPIRPFLSDCSALVAAVLLAFALPPLTPWWVTATGAAFAMIVVKHMYGGLGYNPFNPAMAGYVVLLVSFPVQMTAWLPPSAGPGSASWPGMAETLQFVFAGATPGQAGWDAITMATPLDQVRTGLAMMQTVSEVRQDPLFGDFGGRGWEWIANWFAIGGLWLLYRGVIRWHIPVSMLLGLLVPATIFYLVDPGSHPSAFFHLFSGATMAGAFFIATDPVSAATSEKGRLIYGAGIGLLVFVIRSWGGYPDGVAFAVLLMNMAVPLIDRYTLPRVYGHGH